MSDTQMSEANNLARYAWKLLEPYHALIYFAPEARQAYASIGLKGFWMGYFASRSAALGAVSSSVVAATFFNFHPQMVARAIPDAWRFASPTSILEARYKSADVALQRLLGDTIHSQEVVEAADLAQRAIEGCAAAGRPLFAAHLDLPWPEEPHLRLWHAATLLREFRGDGHVAALLSEGVDGCESHLTLVGTGQVSRDTLQANRGWADDDWDAAQQRLIARGWLDATGMLTAQGQAKRQAIEERTDQLALPPWEYLGETQCNRLFTLMKPISTQIVAQGGIPIPNPMGVPAP